MRTEEHCQKLETDIARMFDRCGIENLWQELALNFYPERASFTREIQLNEEFANHLYDSSPVLLRRDLGNAFASMLRPRGQHWMSASVANRDEVRHRQAAAQFFEHVTSRLRAALYDQRAKFTRAAKECDHDYATFGAAVMSIEANNTRSGLQFRSHHLRDCAWAENTNGDVDKFHLRGQKTARQLIQMMGQGRGTVHEKVTEAAEKNPETKFDIAHITIPVDEYEYQTRKVPNDAAFTSLWLDRSNGHLMREGFAHEFRYVVARWQTMSGSVYPVSPAVMTALPDARMLQGMARVILELSEKIVDPPLVGVSDAVEGDINLAASGVTWVDREYDERLGAAVRPIDLGKNLPAGIEMLDRVRMQLADAMYVSKLNLPERGERTAYEMARRVEEYIRAAVPLFEPLETEYIAPILELSASIMLRLNAFDLRLMPPDLDNRDLTWVFSNPLQDALEKQKVLAGQTTVEMTHGMAAIDPKVAANLDMPRMHREVAEAAGAPAAWLRPETETRKILEADAEREEAAAAMAAITQGGEAARAAGEGGQALQGLVRQ